MMPHNEVMLEGRLRGWLELAWPLLSKDKTELGKKLIPLTLPRFSGPLEVPHPLRQSFFRLFGVLVNPGPAVSLEYRRWVGV